MAPLRFGMGSNGEELDRIHLLCVPIGLLEFRMLSQKR
jgi:hypothetical protein